MIRSILSVAGLLLATVAFGQNITFTQAPRHWQLYQRNTQTNQTEVHLAGTVPGWLGYTRLRVRLTNEAGLEQVLEQTPGANGAFDFALQIPAVCANHTIEVLGLSSQTNQWVTEKSIDHVLAGDVFIVTGQSNAVANQIADPSDVDPYTRSFTVAEGWGTLDGRSPGQWGARVAKRISTELGVPVAIFNQAASGQPIRYFLKDASNPMSGNYGDLLRRFDQAGGGRKARAVLWFQGETDAWIVDPSIYIHDFQALLAAWSSDYQTERTFLFQIRHRSCSSSLPFILEAQRRCGHLANVHLMTTGNTQHDGCHYPYINGHQKHGDRLFDLMTNALYGRSVAEAAPPEVQQIFVSGTNELTLRTTSSASLQVQGWPWNDFVVEGGAGLQILSGTAQGNDIRLMLSGPAAQVTTVTYTGHEGNANDWVVNSRGLSLTAFQGMAPGQSPPPPPTCDLELSIQASEPNPAPGIPTTLTLTARNTGLQTAIGTIVQVKLPPGLLAHTQTQLSQGSFKLLTELWHLGDLAAGASAQLQLVCTNQTSLPKTIRTQVWQCQTPDNDSAPANAGATPLEDDEAFLILNASGASGGIDTLPKPDLELSLYTSLKLAKPFQPIRFYLTLYNRGNSPATGVEIGFLNQSDAGVAAVLGYAQHTATAGTTFNYWLGKWQVPSIAPGQLVRLEYQAFLNTDTELTVVAQVVKENESDTDSVPGNLSGNTPLEDDESVILLNSTNRASVRGSDDARLLKRKE